MKKILKGLSSLFLLLLLVACMINFNNANNLGSQAEEGSIKKDNIDILNINNQNLVTEDNLTNFTEKDKRSSIIRKFNLSTNKDKYGITIIYDKNCGEEVCHFDDLINGLLSDNLLSGYNFYLKELTEEGVIDFVKEKEIVNFPIIYFSNISKLDNNITPYIQEHNGLYLLKTGITYHPEVLVK